MKQNRHIRFALIFVCFILHLLAVRSFSQSQIRTSIVYESGNKTNGVGRDYWFTMSENYVTQSGKYYALYITSPKTTDVFIQVTGALVSKMPVAAGQVITFMVPLGWEVTTSGVVESKGIHVWSYDADIVVHLLSRNPATSDGMLIIPTTGWGKEYVVAAYGSLYEGYSNFVYDFPSEFSIIVDQDSTICTITPHCDIRTTGLSAHPAHIAFTEILNRGQCVQYQATVANNCDNYDVTGSEIVSNKPIGVVGASQCPNIPCENQYCDHVCDMIPPVRTWGKTYHTVPFDTRVAGDTYLVIGSKDEQVIYLNNNVYALLADKFQYYFRPDVTGPSLWTSDAPFLLVQYINSSTYEAQNGGSANGRGDPAMVVINSLEGYTPHIIFQTPNLTTNGFSNYANVIVNNDAIISTLFDGQAITGVKGAARLVIPFTHYTGFRIPQISPGRHEVIGDSAVGVYVYGYGSYDSYAWSGNLGIATTGSPDTIPPRAVLNGQCFSAHIALSDSGLDDSKLNSIVTDSLYNMSFALDPNFLAGKWVDSSFYDLRIIDSTKSGYAKIFAYDVAGNRTTIISTYTPELATITPPVNNFGAGNIGVPTFLYITITNSGTIPYNWQSIKLLLGNQGFVIDSGLVPNTPVAVGSTHIIKVIYTPVTSDVRTDTLELTDGCSRYEVLVIGGNADFLLSNHDFKCIDVGMTKIDTAIVAFNTSNAAIHIDSITLADPLHFAFISIPVLPVVLPGEASAKFMFSFTPDKAGNFATTVNLHSPEIGWRSTTLIGCGQIPAAVKPDGYASSLSNSSSEYASISTQFDRGAKLAVLPPVPNPASHESNMSIRFVYGVRESQPLRLSLYDQLGKEVAVIYDDNCPAGIYETRFTLPVNLPDGSYIYRFSSEGTVLSGKLVVLR